jgi:3-phosphoshikimate 1-carboxyvinyltransferase
VARGAEELRVKESDRIAAMRAALSANGVATDEHADGLTVHGSGGEKIAGGGTVETKLDHRIAMSMTVAGLHARAAVTIDDIAPVATSYPAFYQQLAQLSGADA